MNTIENSVHREPLPLWATLSPPPLLWVFLGFSGFFLWGSSLHIHRYTIAEQHRQVHFSSGTRACVAALPSLEIDRRALAHEFVLVLLCPCLGCVQSIGHAFMRCKFHVTQGLALPPWPRPANFPVDLGPLIHEAVQDALINLISSFWSFQRSKRTMD